MYLLYNFDLFICYCCIGFAFYILFTLYVVKGLTEIYEVDENHLVMYNSSYSCLSDCE